MMAPLRHGITSNFSAGRRGPIDMVVIHVTEGDAASAIAWFANPASHVSAHYLVARDGTVTRFVAEADTAWHAGRVYHPTAALVLDDPLRNPNDRSIGIEHEGTGTEELTAPQRVASVALIRDICARHEIPIDRRHIVGHHEIYSGKTCPGAISVDRLVGDASQPIAAPPSAPRVVWSPFHEDWVIVTLAASDTDWWFVPFKSLRVGTRAETPLSQMPLAPPSIP